jgi:hypothetical protein
MDEREEIAQVQPGGEQEPGGLVPTSVDPEETGSGGPTMPAGDQGG